MSFFSNFIKNHLFFVLILTVVYILSALTVVFQPKGFEVPELVDTYVLFGPALAALILLLSIGFYLVYRFIVKEPPRKDSLYQLIWGISFFILSITFLGMCFQAFGYDFADMNDPVIFLIWRSPMIFWVTGMWIGTIMLFTAKKVYIYVPALLIYLTGQSWFILQLLIDQKTNSIEVTMYGFLFGEFIPMCVIIAYLFYLSGRDLNLTSAWILTFGFAFLALMYAAWAPWHFTTPVNLQYIYFIWFNLFDVSLAFIFAGFFALPKETTAKTLRES